MVELRMTYIIVEYKVQFHCERLILACVLDYIYIYMNMNMGFYSRRVIIDARVPHDWRKFGISYFIVLDSSSYFILMALHTR